jgi:hypothetical protein
VLRSLLRVVTFASLSLVALPVSAQGDASAGTSRATRLSNSPDPGCSFGGGEAAPAQSDRAAAVLKFFSELCAVREMAYDIPGADIPMGSSIGPIDDAARHLGYDLRLDPALARLTIDEPHSFLSAGDGSSATVLLDAEFFAFANELAKLAATSIPIKHSADAIGFSLDEAESIERIKTDAELRKQFVDLLVHALGGPQSTRRSPDEITRVVQYFYAVGLESFALAQEYAHARYKHPAVPPISNLFIDPARAPNDAPRSLRDLEADVFALRMMNTIREVRARRTASGETGVPADANAMYEEIFKAAEFYFVVREILEEALAIKNAAARTPVAAPPKQDVDRIADCLKVDNCLVGDLAGLAHRTKSGPDRAPLALRLAVAKRAEEIFPTRETLYGPVFSLTNRNARLLWEITKDESKAAIQEAFKAQ